MKLNIQLSIKVNKNELQLAKEYCASVDSTIHIKVRRLIKELAQKLKEME